MPSRAACHTASDGERKYAERLTGVDVAIGSALVTKAESGAELGECGDALSRRALPKLRFQSLRSILTRLIHRTITCPPSTTRVWPVMQRAASEQR